MDNLQESIRKYINQEKFLFVWKEENLHNKAFLNRTTLKVGVLISSIITLVLGTGFVLHSIEFFSFLFFLAFFLPNLVLMAGSVLLLLSMEHLERNRAYWGYIVTAISVWFQATFGALSLLFAFIYSPKYFFQTLFFKVIVLAFVLLITTYASWIDYCFLKHLTSGKRELVEYGREEVLMPKEQGAGMESNYTNNNLINEPRQDPEMAPEIRIEEIM